MQDSSHRGTQDPRVRAPAVPTPGRLALLTLGLAACASSVLFIKLSALDPVLLCALRLWVAVVVLAPLFARDLWRHRASLRAGDLLRSILPGAVLALHFVLWVIGARLTPAVNATLIVNMVPAVTPLLLYMLARERVSARELLATGVAILGVVWLGGGDLRLSAEYALGDAVCFGAMVLFAFYLVLARRNRGLPGLWLYVVPLYACAATLCSVASGLLEDPGAVRFSWREVGLVLGLGLVPTVIGHSILNHSMQHLRGQIVGIANLSQPVFAGGMAFATLGEIPSGRSYLAGVLVLAGVALAVRSARDEAGAH